MHETNPTTTDEGNTEINTNIKKSEFEGNYPLFGMQIQETIEEEDTLSPKLIKFMYISMVIHICVDIPAAILSFLILDNPCNGSYVGGFEIFQETLSQEYLSIAIKFKLIFDGLMILGLWVRLCIPEDPEGTCCDEASPLNGCVMIYLMLVGLLLLVNMIYPMYGIVFYFAKVNEQCRSNYIDIYSFIWSTLNGCYFLAVLLYTCYITEDNTTTNAPSQPKSQTKG